MPDPVPRPITRLIEEFGRLPTIGPKTAQRLAFFLLRAPAAQVAALGAAVTGLREHVVSCARCGNYADQDPCSICCDPARDQQLLCVVEDPLDLLAIERSGGSFGAEGAPPASSYMLEAAHDPGDDLPAWLTADDVDAYVQSFTKSGFRGGLNWYRNIDHNWVLTAPFQDRKIEQPALFVAGDRDVVPFNDEVEREMREAVTGLRDVVLLPGIGHWVQQEAPDAVNRALLDFLKSL